MCWLVWYSLCVGELWQFDKGVPGSDGQFNSAEFVIWYFEFVDV